MAEPKAGLQPWSLDCLYHSRGTAYPLGTPVWLGQPQPCPAPPRHGLRALVQSECLQALKRATYPNPALMLGFQNIKSRGILLLGTARLGGILALKVAEPQRVILQNI